MNSEEKRRRESESLVANFEGQVRHLRERLVQSEGDLRDSKLERGEVLTRLSAKESQVAELQRQLAEELTQRQARFIFEIGAQIERKSRKIRKKAA